MYLTRHQTHDGARWARNGNYLPSNFSLSFLLQLSSETAHNVLTSLPEGPAAEGPLLAPIESNQEVWACGVTYLRSREARKTESSSGDAYQRVYDADRPEIFQKAAGWRTVGHEMRVRIRRDSEWNVPEPELVIMVNHAMEIIGYSAGNDISSRSIEGENPLYLPQAKVFDGACSVGPGILLVEPQKVNDVAINIEIKRDSTSVFCGESSTAQMKRTPCELAQYLGRELSFPNGAFLMTGTGIVPPDEFTLQSGDQIDITVGELELTNTVAP
jgi:2-dehydro-3-deoxy-D-arabinonate dehydratase